MSKDNEVSYTCNSLSMFLYHWWSRSIRPNQRETLRVYIITSIDTGLENSGVDSECKNVATVMSKRHILQFTAGSNSLRRPRQVDEGISAHTAVDCIGMFSSLHHSRASPAVSSESLLSGGQRVRDVALCQSVTSVAILFDLRESILQFISLQGSTWPQLLSSSTSLVKACPHTVH